MLATIKATISSHRSRRDGPTLGQLRMGSTSAAAGLNGLISPPGDAIVAFVCWEFCKTNGFLRIISMPARM
jgi:hypothetical protein